MTNLLEKSNGKRLYVVSGDLDSQTFHTSLYEESFCIYTKNVPRVGEYIGGHFGSGLNPGHLLKRVNGVLYSISGDIFIYIDKTVINKEDILARVDQSDDDKTAIERINNMLKRHKKGYY